MNNKELITLALHSLRANKMRSILTTLGIVIGVFSVILLMSLGNGLQKYITDQVSGLGSNLLFVVPGKIGGARDPGDFANKLLISDARTLEARLKTIAYVSPIISKVTKVQFGNKTNEDTTISGTTASYPEIIKTELTRGTYFTAAQDKNGSKVAVIGQTVVENLFPRKEPIGQKITISGGKYTVIGIMKKKGSAFGVDQDNTVFIPLSVAQGQFGIDRANAIYLSAIRPELVSVVKERTKTILLKRLEPDDFSVQTQEQALTTINDITNMLTIGLGGIAAISLLVGGIGIMNIMLVSVTERTKEIGLRKALGARRSDILKQFLLESIMLSLVGGGVGVFLGVGLSYVISQFFVSQVTPFSIILAFGFSVGIGVVFGMMPAIRASKLSPIEALRYE